MIECYQENCPFRYNDTTSVWECQCVACPNRDNGMTTWFATNTTGKLGDGLMIASKFGGTSTR